MESNNFDKQAAINSSIENGIINIDKLLACNDFETIKEGLNNYPLTINEYLKAKYAQGDYRAVFQWAVDNKVNQIADYLITGKLPMLNYGLRGKESAFDDLVDSVIDDAKGKGKNFINDQYFYKKSNGYYGYSRPIKPDFTKEEVVNKIITDISLKLDKQTLTAGLTREYFEDLFNKGNYELLTIKLCVRLEAILKCDFHYEGTFEEMLTKYSKQHGYDSVDDGWGYMSDVETDQNKIFHKLRKYRNDIVHAEKNEASLAPDQLKLAIEYVCKLG